MSNLGDLLLYSISALRKMTWAGFSRAFNELYPRGLHLERAAEQQRDRYDRRRAALTLDVLGHVDLDFVGREGTLTAAQATLIQLPTRGLSRAILVGRRSSHTMSDLNAASTGSTRVYSQTQRHRSAFAPNRIEIVSESNDGLQRLASLVGIVYDSTPAAWTLGAFVGSVHDYMAQLTWEERGELNWPRSDFSPQALQFVRNLQQSEETVLSRYDDPTRGTQFFLLRKGTLAAQTDPNWGRYAVLEPTGRSVFEYEQETGRLAVPANIPLPRLFARAFSACSGLAPALLQGEISDKVVQTEVYEAVPRDLLSVCAAKLGQPRPWEAS